MYTLLQNLLRGRSFNDGPVQIGIVGAGKFGTGLAVQLAAIDGINVGGVADLEPRHARHAWTAAGVPDDAVREVESASAVDECIRKGQPCVLADGTELARSELVELVVERHRLPFGRCPDRHHGHRARQARGDGQCGGGHHHRIHIAPARRLQGLGIHAGRRRPAGRHHEPGQLGAVAGIRSRGRRARDHHARRRSGGHPGHGPGSGLGLPTSKWRGGPSTRVCTTRSGTGPRPRSR